MAESAPNPNEPTDESANRLRDLADAIHSAGTIESKQKMIQMMPNAAECAEAVKFLKRLGVMKEVRH